MYSSILSSQQNQIKSSGFPAHSGQFSVRVFKAPSATSTSYYGSSKYDSSYRSAAPSDYYSSARSYDDPSSRFPSSSDSQRSSQYPTSIRTPGLTSRDYNASHAPNTITQSSYNITRGNVQDTYVYEQSDVSSSSEFDDAATNESYYPISLATSTENLVTTKRPSPLPDRDGAISMRHQHLGRSMLVPPSSGSATSRVVPPSHEDALRSGDGTHFRHHSTTPSTTTHVPISSSSSATDVRVLSSSSGNYTTTSVIPPPPPSQLPSAPVPPVWHHAIPTIPPSEADTEDVSLEARMNAEYNSISTGALYNAGANAHSHGSNSVPVIPAPVPPSRTERNSPPQISRISPNGTSQLHIKIPDDDVIPDVARDGSSLSKESTGLPLRSPASSTVVESLEEGRGTGYVHHRNSTVMIGERGQLLAPFDDRWVNDQEGDKRSGPSYSRVTVPPPAPELRREYSNTNATYASSPTRASMLLASSVEDQRLVPVPPIPIPIPTPGPRQRRDSRASYTIPPPRERRTSDARDHLPPARSSPPRLEEQKINTSPRRRAGSTAGLQSSETGTTIALPSSGTTVPSRSTEPYGSSRPERRTSPPVASGNINRSPSTVPLEHPQPAAYGSEPSRSRHQQGGSSPERSAPVPVAQNPCRPPPDNHRSQADVPYRSQSTAPPSSSSRRPSHTTDPYRPQSTAPPETSHRSHHPSYTSSAKPPPSSSYQNTAQVDNSRVPSTRKRTNSVSWSRNTSTAPPLPSKTPSPPSRHAQPPVTRSNSRPGSPILEPAPPPPQRSQSQREPEVRRERRSSNAYATSIPQVTGIQTTKDTIPTRDHGGSPPSYSVAISSGSPRDSGSVHSIPPREKRTSSKHRNVGDESGKPVLTVRNPSPRSEASSDRTASPPHVQQSIPASRQPAPAGSYVPNANATTTSHQRHPTHRRSTLPYHSRPGVNGHAGIDEYGQRVSHTQTPNDQPKRRLSDGDQNDRPSFTFTGVRRGGQIDRCVRWNDNLICPSPITPNRRKGWYNRRGDQLWTNDGAFRSPQLGSEYPMDLDDYPEYGEGWMNEEGVRIDMAHRLVPKAPLRSALKPSKTLGLM
ncbi:hypothetical protein AGABI1DRAFT_108758 [Agaricus bisporus var. burnettii JB137-S8]|uniref:Uncharacterized protein n=1 Tax=Agaricus bisporus var. burnettii (strain JB137-S8 / ATCC MYA-4627 / FGSC 10392) TaxID=597362 RepID=K5X0L7_AGABU|nr:uncharacterized protein AGABI1DRAFT_108758 [Agaricus bisporus var. burnettii JB137-S8]EKM76432.1 hypothetical protein AGABI1DRAFT_108758 [Agaricus bisporus var. burnettii JB137-S8]